jgi:alpha-glucosidase
MVGRQPGRLMESDIIENLSTPSKIGDASWVKPGMMAWDHWWTGNVRMNTATIKDYIQLASDMGWPYQLIDWQWYGPFNKPEANITAVNPDVNMDEVRQFAKDKNVKLFLWMHWADVERNQAYAKAFALYEKWGIAGVKIDFMDRDDQEIVNWYEKIAKAAADHHLMLIFHGAYKPTGLERTYPNQITREGILGNEYNRWSKRVTTEHKLTLPFTRFLTGPADFTPGGFLNRQPEQFKIDTAAAQVQGTRAQEFALFVVYNSPITVACDLPDHYRNQSGADFLKIVPTVWDETKVIDASVSDYIVEARRSGDNWFIGAFTDNTARNFNIPLNFLPKGKYKLKVWKDAKDSNINAEHLEMEERIVSATDKLSISMVMNGGYVARLEKL